MDYEKARVLRAKRLGVLLRDARLARKVTLTECAEALGISPRTLRAYERGERSPSLPELEALAYYFQLPLEHFWSSEILSDDPEPIEQVPLARLITLRQRIIGVRLRQLREAKGMTLKDLAEQAQIPESRLRAYEYGERPIPVPELETFAAILDVPLKTFWDQEGPLGQWHRQQEEMEQFLALPEEIRAFVCKPINRPYLELAMRLSEMDVRRLREVAEGLLEITL